MADDKTTVHLELDTPELDQERDWSCKFRIIHGDKVVASDEGTGEDALAAIIGAIAGMRWHFERSGLRASWFHDQDGAGIPVFLPEGLGREFDLRLRRLVEEAVKERTRELEDKNSS